MTATVSIFGIRHHGPGSARSLLAALEDAQPDCLLVEGPEEAEGLLEFVASPDLAPPVAMLLYDVEDPRRCAFYPFAEFSPEWQALRWAAARGVPVRFMDLPQKHMLALEKEHEEALRKAAEETPEAESGGAAERQWHRDPVQLLAEAAGFSDTERWWEYFVEQRHDAREVFAAIAEAMTALRAELGEPPEEEARRERLREAWMRNAIRHARKEFQRVAVVCGAWHVPALATMPPAKEDNAQLKGLPKLKLEATWAPWTYSRLASGSGYGAGVDSPGWYDFLWRSSSEAADPTRLATRWLAEVASVLRDRDFDVSSAHLIEAVRLTDALCAMRGKPLPALEDLNEAIVSVLLFGDPVPLALIHKRLVVGERIGTVPEGAPSVPLQADLARTQKRLRLKPSADFKDLSLDLRNENDLERSRLLHRLLLLDIPWGEFQGAGGRGTFRETWRLKWSPQLVVATVAAAIHGTTVGSAAHNRAVQLAGEANQLSDVTAIVPKVLLADLPQAVPLVMARLEALAAVASDVTDLLEAVPSLAEATRYGNVRGTDLASLSHVLESVAMRACVGLGAACASLDDEAAAQMAQRMTKVQAAILLVEHTGLRDEWTAALRRLISGGGSHGLVLGKACRLMLDAGALTLEETAQQLALAISYGTPPSTSGAWLEGFLGGSGIVLIHSDDIWAMIDAWVCGLNSDAFVEVLPLLRRTFTGFEVPERQMLAQRVADSTNAKRGTSLVAAEHGIDTERANAALPLLALILGQESGR